MAAGFIVLVTGPPGAGKSTLGPKLAELLDVVCISRDVIHDMVFDGWEPFHPALSDAPPASGPNLNEGRLNWDIFLWVLEQVSRKAGVVGETPINHQINRDRLLELRRRVPVPVIEVLLDGDREVLMERVLRRAADPSSHPIKVHFTVEGARSILRGAYEPLLGEESIRLDTTDLSSLDLVAVVGDIRERLVARLGPAPQDRPR